MKFGYSRASTALGTKPEAWLGALAGIALRGGASVIALSVLGGSGIAYAQDNSDQSTAQSSANMIIVSAQKRDEQLIDVPISVAVADQDALERQQVNQLQDLTRISPALEVSTVSNSPGGGGSIRGIGTQSFETGAVGSVGIIVDQISQGNLNNLDLFDVERVEVLKGPQGTLFGLTTSAGAINIVTNSPDFNEFSARVRTELSFDDFLGSGFGQQIIQGVVNVPLADNAALRISGNVNLRQGYARNLTTGDLDDRERWGVRGRLLWEPTDRLTINLIGDYTEDHLDGMDFFTVYRAPAAYAQQVLDGCGIVVSPDNRDYCSDKELFEDNKNYGLSARIEYEFDTVTLTSITAGRWTERTISQDIFRLPPPFIEIQAGPESREGELLSQEFRIANQSGSTVEFTAGAFFSRSEDDAFPSPSTVTIYADVPFPPFLLPIVVADNLGGFSNTVDESQAIFGQATIHATDQLSLIVGARYSWEQLAVDELSLDTGGTFVLDTSFSKLSWKLGALYEISPSATVYATASRGYKGPQIARPDPATPGRAGPIVVTPELPTSFEIGLKTSVLDDRVLLELNGFYNEVKDYQTTVCAINGMGGISCIPQNVSEVVSKGIEFTAFGQVTDNFNLSTGILWNSAEYPSNYFGDDGSDLSGQQIVNAPEWKFTFSGEYSAPVSSGVEAFVSANAVYKSKVRYLTQADPLGFYPGHWTLGGRIGVRDTDRDWSLSLFARNITDKRVPQGIFGNFLDPAAYGQFLSGQGFRYVGLAAEFGF